MKIAVTGSTGYVGRRLHLAASYKGHKVISLSRHAEGMLPSDWIQYDLSSPKSIDLPSDVDVIIHLAANTSFRGELGEHEEIEAAKRLISTAKAGGMRLIFISSQTARIDAPTTYGRIKFQIEQLVVASGGTAIRPGLVYGGPSNGLYGELIRLVKRFYVLPMFLPAPRIQPIHVDDLVIGILKVAESSPDSIGPIVMLGSVNSISFTHFLQSIGRYRLRTLRIFIPFPSIIIRLLSGILAKIVGGIVRLNSLFNLVEMKTKTDLDILDLNLRPLVSGLNVSGSNGRRALLMEGFAFYVYIVGAKNKKVNMRNYVRVIERLRNSVALKFPFWHQIWPFWIALIDSKKINQSPWTGEFRWRLKAATLLAEASTIGAINFIDPRGSGFMRSLNGILGALFFEIAISICKLLFSPFFQLLFLRKVDSNHES
jgi:nucleoside-diphosphate-sugar epimerase